MTQTALFLMQGQQNTGIFIHVISDDQEFVSLYMYIM